MCTLRGCDSLSAAEAEFIHPRFLYGVCFCLPNLRGTDIFVRCTRLLHWCGRVDLLRGGSAGGGGGEG